MVKFWLWLTFGVYKLHLKHMLLLLIGLDLGFFLIRRIKLLNEKALNQRVYITGTNEKTSAGTTLVIVISGQLGSKYCLLSLLPLPSLINH